MRQLTEKFATRVGRCGRLVRAAEGGRRIWPRAGIDRRGHGTDGSGRSVAAAGTHRVRALVHAGTRARWGRAVGGQCRFNTATNSLPAEEQ